MIIANRTMLGGIFSISLVYACGADFEAQDRHGEEAEEVSSAEFGLVKGTPGAINGQGDYCSSFGVCNAGEGDCDRHDQCSTGTLCGRDNGPKFGFGVGSDVCTPVHCTDKSLNADETQIDCGGSCGSICGPPSCLALQPGAPNKCSAGACACSVGQGDCNVDSDCTAGLICGGNNGPKFGLPAGSDACVPAHCSNRQMDGDETRIDCGGQCGSVCAGSSAVLLGAAGNYVVLAESAISNVPTSVVTGDMGLSPAAASFVTGFSITRVGASWTSPQVVGSIFAADNDPPTPSNLTTAVADMHLAYTDAASRPTPHFLNLGRGAIGGRTLVPGLYKWTSAVTVSSDVTLSGGANDVWIFQITGNLEMSAAQAMTLSGGAQARNIFWQVAGLVNLGSGAHAEGIMLSKTAIVLGAGASINGRLLAQTAVNLSSSTVTRPAL